MKPWPIKHIEKSNVLKNKVLDKPTCCWRLQSIFAPGQRKGFAASCRFLWIFLDMVTLTSHWLLHAPLVTFFYCYVSICQTAHGMGTRCCPAGFASYSVMTSWRHPATALWSWQTIQRLATRRHRCSFLPFFQQKGSITIYNTEHPKSKVLAPVAKQNSETKRRQISSNIWINAEYSVALSYFEHLVFLSQYSGGWKGYHEHATWNILFRRSQAPTTRG